LITLSFGSQKLEVKDSGLKHLLVKKCIGEKVRRIPINVETK